MLNIFGLLLAFFGAVVSVWDVIRSKPDERGITFDEITDLGKKAVKNKRLTVWGLSLIGIGFLLQLIAAIKVI